MNRSQNPRPPQPQGPYGEQSYGDQRYEDQRYGDQFGGQYGDPYADPYVDPYGEGDSASWFNSNGRPAQTRHGYGTQAAYPQEQEQQQYVPGIPEQRQREDQPTYALHTVEETPAEPSYHIPVTPEAGWDMAASRRRAWVSRAVLLCILLIQTVLSLRLSNTAFQDEALYLSSGHEQLDHLLNGTPVTTDYASYFSGSPTLYPVLAALVDGWFGLTGARVLSLLFMLGTTALLYSFSRRMFNERAALAGAALFAVTQSTIVLGYFATYDAPAIFLLAAAAWVVVRTDRAPVAVVLLAAPPAVLAVGVKYASALFLPTLVVLALLTAWPHRGKAAFARALLLGVGIAGLLGVALYGTDVLEGVRATTTAREHGTDSAVDLLEKSALWGGLMFLTACGGAVSYIRRGRMNESPLALRLSGPGWRWRLLLGLLLCGTATLAPAYQIHLSTSVALYKHLGFGLLFAAPMAGIGVTRLVGAHFRYPQLGILLWVTVLCLGLSQSVERFASWPGTSGLNTVLRAHITPDKGRYLASTPNVPVYYLRDITEQSRWTSLYGIGYKDDKGKVHRGADGYRTAIKDGWFDMVVLDGVATPQMDKVVIAALKESGKYRLAGTVPFKVSGGDGTYRIWIKSS
ncbi:ArnT family glycosyltransferase [Streptomyces sp. NPDC057621]|uniref:Glycosyltransferase family 39 protein n=1 Tax=Streptomyces liliiviolaceus TaxID=2823109 RepID=A0A941B2V5_9ACTN|nr:glycosyltransferase family 39 protein [Streptomyces liliiviolaceus]MBQ0848545.1 glycosyltransferase family 39 protein [Streptomyces liliiviolaceus]